MAQHAGSPDNPPDGAGLLNVLNRASVRECICARPIRFNTFNTQAVVDRPHPAVA
jgi:hypothetical protein